MTRFLFTRFNYISLTLLTKGDIYTNVKCCAHVLAPISCIQFSSGILAFCYASLPEHLLITFKMTQKRPKNDRKVRKKYHKQHNQSHKITNFIFINKNCLLEKALIMMGSEKRVMEICIHIPKMYFVDLKLNNNSLYGFCLPIIIENVV